MWERSQESSRYEEPQLESEASATTPGLAVFWPTQRQRIGFHAACTTFCWLTF